LKRLVHRAYTGLGGYKNRDYSIGEQYQFVEGKQGQIFGDDLFSVSCGIIKNGFHSLEAGKE
jgi:hypothetical protein